MKRKSLVLGLALLFVLSISTVAFAKESVDKSDSKVGKSPAAPSIAAKILKDSGISHVVKVDGEKPVNYIAQIAALMGSGDTDLNGSYFQGISKSDPSAYLLALQNFLQGIGAPVGNVLAEDFGVMEQSGVIGYTVGFGLVDATAADTEKIVIELFNGTTLLGTLTSNGVQTNYPDATSLSGPFDVLGTFDYEADGNWTYSEWPEGSEEVIPDKAVITVTFDNGLVWSATNDILTGTPSWIEL